MSTPDTTTDKAPGAFNPATAASLPPDVALPPKPAEDTKPKRPTTRAGREAAAAAKRAAKSSKAESKPKTTAPRKSSLETRLTGSLVTLGTVVAATGAMVSPAVTADGVLITQHAAHVAAALDKVAQNDPRVKAALEKMLTAGTWSGLVAAVLPLAVGIAANHGAIPAGMAAMLGAEVPDVGQAPAEQYDPLAGPIMPTGVPVV